MRTRIEKWRFPEKQDVGKVEANIRCHGTHEGGTIIFVDKLKNTLHCAIILQLPKLGKTARVGIYAAQVLAELYGSETSSWGVTHSPCETFLPLTYVHHDHILIFAPSRDLLCSMRMSITRRSSTMSEPFPPSVQSASAQAFSSAAFNALPLRPRTGQVQNFGRSAGRLRIGRRAHLCATWKNTYWAGVCYTCGMREGQSTISVERPRERREQG
jgi:hypothetical protein